MLCVEGTSVWRKRVGPRLELQRAAEALRLLGPAAVQVLGVEGDVMVLERVLPGNEAAELSDEASTFAIAESLLRLWTPVPDNCDLPNVRQECAALYDERAVAPLPPDLVCTARSTLDELLRDAPVPRVLHGDLHLHNLLWSDDRGWVAIDPHGLVGDSAYDVGPLLINPWTEDAARLLDRRLAQLVEVLQMPRERLAAWGLVRAVLAEAWHVQDTGAPAGGPLQVGQLLATR